MTPDAIREWRKRLDAGRDIIKPIIDAGKINVSRQQNKSLSVTPTRDTVTLPMDFAYTEQKKASLFFQTPDIIGDAVAPQWEPSVPVFTAVMNEKLGIRGVNAKAAIFEALSDVLCPVGFGVIKVGYENVVDGVKTVPTGKQIPNPNFQPPAQPGAILGLSQPPVPMVPETMDAPNIISETYYWRRVSPGWFRVNDDFKGSDFDDCTFQAMRFEEDAPDGEGTSQDAEEELLLTKPNGSIPSKKKKRGFEVWEKAHVFDPSVKHPDLLRTFKIYDDNTVTGYRDSPFQRWIAPGSDAPTDKYARGARLFAGKGFPFQVFTLHYISDSAFPPSMVSQSRQIVDEGSKGRTQMIQRRDRAMPQVGYDATRVLPDQLQKIERNENTAFIGFNGPVSEDMFKEINKGTFGRDNHVIDETLHRDLDQIWAMGSGGGVVRSDTGETATKSNQIQTAIDTRSEADRTRILEGFVKAVNKTAALLRIFADEEDYVHVVGPDGAKKLVAWNKDSLGDVAFTAKPDSHVRIDGAQKRQQTLQAYNQLRKDPNCNEQYLISEVASALGMDPSRLYKPSPPPAPEKPNASWALKMEDFIGPAAPIAVEIAKQVGIVVSPQALQMTQQLAAHAAAMLAQQQAVEQQQQAQQPHGGAASVTEPISKHNEQITGGTPGIGVQ